MREQTDRFFRRPVAELDAELNNGFVVRVYGTDLSVKVDQTKPWDQVGPKYLRDKDPKNLSRINLGEVKAHRIPFRRMSQFLIRAQGEQDHTACVQVLRGSRYDARSGVYVPMPNEGDVAKTLGMEDDAVEQLWVLDPKSPTLYIVRNRIVTAELSKSRVEEVINREPSAEEGGAFLKRLAGE